MNANFYHLNPYPGTKVYHDNFDKIIKKYGNEHNYFLALGDASQFVINLTEFTDDAYFQHKYRMQTEIKERTLELRAIRLADDVIPSDFIHNGMIFCVHPRHINTIAEDRNSS